MTAIREAWLWAVWLWQVRGVLAAWDVEDGDD